MRTSQFLEKNFSKFWNGLSCRNKSCPFLLLNIVVHWQSSNTKACAKKLSQVLANNIKIGGGHWSQNVRYCSSFMLYLCAFMLYLLFIFIMINSIISWIQTHLILFLFFRICLIILGWWCGWRSKSSASGYCLAFAWFFCQFQASVACKSVPYKKPLLSRALLLGSV